MSTYAVMTAVLRTGAAGTLLPTAQPLSVPRGESFTQLFAVVDEAGAAVNLTGSVVIASIGPLNGPAAISRQADNDAGTGGTGSFTLADTETDLGPAPLWWDLELVDADGNTSKIVLRSTFTPTGGVYTPAQDVSVLPSQAPLAHSLSSFTMATGADASSSHQQVTVAGAVIGNAVQSVLDLTDLTDVTADFESTISITAKIVQTSVNLSGKKLLVILLVSG